MIEKIKKGDQVPFAQVSIEMLCDPHISAKAKGILCYMLSKPENWQFNVKTMSQEMRENKDTIAAILRELIEIGYVHREEIREGGKIRGYDYTVYQSPHPKTSDTVDNERSNGSKGHDSPYPKTPEPVSSDTLNREREEIEKEEGEAKDLGTSKSRETEEAPSEDTATTVFSKKVEKILNAQAPGTQITAETRQAIDRFGETYGIDALRDVILKYIDEKERDKIRKYVDTDLPERLADATLDLYVPPPKERPEPKEMPVFKYACPQCHHDQSHEVKTNSFGCHACGHSYDKTARDYFREVAAEAKAS